MKKQYLMAYFSYNKLWRSEFYNNHNFSAKNKMQGLSLNQLKLKINDTYKTDEKRATKVEAVNDEDVINKFYPDGNSSITNVQITYIETGYNEFQLHNSKQSVDYTIFYDKRLYDKYENADEVLKNYLFVERYQNSSNHFIFRFEWCENINKRWTFFKRCRKRELTSNKWYTLGCIHTRKLFDRYGCGPPNNLSRFIIKRNRHCFYCEYKLQGLACKRVSYFAVCLFLIYLIKVIRIGFKTASLNLHY